MVRPMFTFSTFLVAIVVSSVAPKPAAAASVTPPIVRVTGIVVNSVVAQAGELVANATVTLNVLGRTIAQEVQIPLTLDGTAAAPCNILNLALGPVNLDLLGLMVNLDDCEGGPVMVDITGVPGELLGDLLCSIAGLLDQGVDLSAILDELTTSDVPLLTGALRDVLNEVFDALLTTGAVATAQAQATGSGHVCNILELEIPQGLTLDVLGLLVETSPICLDVHAERGSGNLLGNLLCSLTGLLDTPANDNALQSLARNILGLLDRLGL